MSRREAWMVRHVYPWAILAGVVLGVCWGQP